MTAKICATPCETCEKQGLPLLLTRYAVHTVESRAPALTGTLGGGPLDEIPLGAHARYGLRLLRSGYVYVYDEARRYRDEYFVTNDGFLTKLPPRPKTGSRGAPASEFACARSGAAPLAGVITIRNPKHAKTIWIGFSDVQWTDATWAVHEDRAYRQQHMRKIVITAGRVAAQPHTAALDSVDTLVPEYALDAQAVSKHIDPWTVFPFNRRKTQTKDLKQAVQQARAQGGAAIVALYDPVSIVAELDALMNHRLQVFADEPARKRPLAASVAIQQVEQIIRSQAVDLAEAAREKQATDLEKRRPNPGRVYTAQQQDAMKPIRARQVETLRTLSTQETRRIEDEKWESYRIDKRLVGGDKPRFKEQEMNAWLAQYEKELKTFDQEHIVPLAIAHRDWMQCGATTQYFACNYDEADVDNGLAYALSISICIGSTQDKAVCFDLYTKWLGASTFEKSNLLLNALALNQKKAKEQLQKADAANLDWRSFSWDALSKTLAQMYQAKWQAMAETVATRLVTRAMGPLAKIAERSAPKGQAKISLVTLSIFAGKPYTVIDVTGSKRDFRKLLVKQLMQLSWGQQLDENKLRRAVAFEMRRMEINGVQLDGTEQKRFLIFLDETYIKGAAHNLSADAKVKYVATNYSDINKIKALEAAHLRQRLGQPVGRFIKGGYPYLAGLIEVFFQYQALVKLGEKELKAMRHEETESRYRLNAGLMAFWGSVADLTGQGLGKAVPLIPKVAWGWALGAKGLLTYGGRGIGIFGAGIIAYWDNENRKLAAAEGQYGLAGLYIFSASVGFLTAFLFVFAASNPFTLTLVALLLAVSVLIEYVKENDIQEWLKRSWWGNGVDGHYPDIETEMNELKKAMA